MTRIPPFIKVTRDKTAPIPSEYINPDPWEGEYFPPGFGERFVFLDKRID